MAWDSDCCGGGCGTVVDERGDWCDDCAAYMDEGPSCSICDALGHGYPGGGPCPLEERGYWDARDEEIRYAW